MDIEETPISLKDRILGFSENHPYILLLTVVVLVLVIIYMYMSHSGFISGKFERAISRRKKKEPTDEDEEEVDELIESIHEKQKKRK